MSDTSTFIGQVAQLFAERVLNGSALWQRDVRGVLPSMPLTRSGGQDVPLSGGNAMLLAQVMVDRGWSDPRFFTQENIAALGLEVQPGAKGTAIQFVRPSSAGQQGSAHEVVTFQMFNANEVAGLGVWESKRSDWPLETLGTRLLPKFEIDIVHDQVDSAFFDQADGKVHMPPPSAFPTIGAYVGVAIHELSHGSAKDTDRVISGTAGTASFAREELRAEMASMQLSVALGLPHDISRHQGFVPEWKAILENDPGEFFRAARDAEKMAALVLWHVKSVEQEVAVEQEAAGEIDPPVVGGDVVAANQVPAKESTQAETPAKKGGAGKAQYLATLQRQFDNRQAILAVPFSQKEEAMAAGAKYYGIKKLWFAPADADMAKLKQWDSKSTALSSSLGPSRGEMIASIQAEMAKISIVINDRLTREMEEADDGVWGYGKVEAKTSNRSAAWVMYLKGKGDDPTPCAIFINNKSGARSYWRYDGPALTPEQMARMRQEARIREETLQREIADKHEAVAKQAVAVWGEAKIATSQADHGYLVKKGIAPHDSRLAKGTDLLKYDAFKNNEGKTIIRAKDLYLLRALRDVEGKIWSLQAISEDGKVKTYMVGGRTKGLFDLVGAESLPLSGGFGMTEGFATGATLKETAGWPVANCFSAGNLEAVAQEFASRLSPDVTPVIGKDNDQFFIERTFEMLSDTGINGGPTLDGSSTGSIQVQSGADSVRNIDLGEVIADGQWHQAPRGKYKLTLEHEGKNPAVVTRAILEMSVTGDNGNEKAKTLQASNRGDDASKVVLEALPRAIIVTPTFSSLEGRPTDLNDLGKREGNQVVRRQLEAQGAGHLIAPPVQSKSVDRSQALAAFARRPLVANSR